MLEYKKDGWKAAIALAPTLLLMIVFTFWPIINSVIMAFINNYKYMYGNWWTQSYWTQTAMMGQETGVGIENFISVFVDPIFWESLKNTGMIVIVSVPLTIILGLLIAVGLNSIKKLQGFYQTIFFLPYVTNTIALGLVFNALFHVNDGLVNRLFNLTYDWVSPGATWGRSFLVLMLYSLWSGLAFKIIVFLSGMQSVDKQYYQAAQIDGTSKFRTFRKITVPLISPMILYVTITSFIGAFKVYSSVIAIFGTGGFGPTGKEDYMMITIVGYVYKCMNDGGREFGKGSAASIILFAIILLITLVQMQVSKKRVHY